MIRAGKAIQPKIGQMVYSRVFGDDCDCYGTVKCFNNKREDSIRVILAHPAKCPGAAKECSWSLAFRNRKIFIMWPTEEKIRRR